MKAKNLFCLLIFLLALVLFMATVSTANTPAVPRWQTHDPAFKSTSKHDNPSTIASLRDYRGVVVDVQKQMIELDSAQK